MQSISKEFMISCAHQIEGHPKCGRMHGHNYIIKVVIAGVPDEDTGMILDYAILSKIMSPLMEAMDHKYLLSRDNMDKENAVAQMLMMQQQTYALGTQFSTAECISEFILQYVVQELSQEEGVFSAVAVEVSETPKTNAIASLMK